MGAQAVNIAARAIMPAIAVICIFIMCLGLCEFKRVTYF
jgi:hypothetical protein